MTGLDKKKLYPNENIKTVCYISNLPKRPNVEIGEYTYYSDNNKSPEKFYDNIEHHYEFLGDKYNRENETSTILKTKRAKCLFFSLPFFSDIRPKSSHLTLIKDLLKGF